MKMKNSRIIAIFACVMLAIFILGLTDVLHMAELETGEETEKDRLIGVFITKEHLDLFDAEGYFRDYADQILAGGKLDEREQEKYQGRLYATLVESRYTSEESGEARSIQEYVFEGIDGICYFIAKYADEAGSYHGSSGDEAISDGHVEIFSTDEGDNISLEGTIYLSAAKGPATFYYNPVYQTGQGDVYTVTGAGMSYGDGISFGMSGSWEIKEESTSAVADETSAAASRVKITVCYIDTPERLAVIQFNEDGQVLSREEYLCGELPESLRVEPGTEYLVVETRSKDSNAGESITRELFQPEDEGISAFYCRSDGICVKQFCSVDWIA